MGTVTAMLAAGQASSGTSAGALTVAVLLAVFGSSFLATVVTTVMTGLRATSNVRRDRYAAAVEAVVAWCEFPYRIRRRTDDDPETLTRLTEFGHELQEKLARHHAWVAAENSVMREEFDQLLATVQAPVGLSMTEAWNSAPITTAAGMNVTPFGPGNLTPALNRLHVAIAYRFGVGRLLPPYLVRRRLRTRSSAGTP